MNITIKPWGLVAIALVAGCAGAAVSKFIVPPARAQNVPRWEYLCFEADYLTELQEKANAAGREGWELLGGPGAASGKWWCAKRPLP